MLLSCAAMSRIARSSSLPQIRAHGTIDPAMRPAAPIRRMIEFAVTDLPQPLSPNHR